MRSPGCVNGSVELQQSGPLVILTRIKGHSPTCTARAVAWKRCGDRCGTPEELLAAGQIQCMDAVEVIPRGVFRYRNQVNRAARAIDTRRRGDADLRRNLAAAAIIARSLAWQLRRNLPQRLGRTAADVVSVKSVNVSMLRRQCDQHDGHTHRESRGR